MKAIEIEGQIAEAADPRVYAGIDAMHKVTRLCNGAKFDAATIDRPVAERVIKGDPTDTALLRFSEALSVPSLNINTSSLLENSRRLFEIPFNSKNKWMLSVIEANDVVNGDISEKRGKTWMFAKGAPDILFRACSTVMKSDGSVVPFDDSAKEQFSVIQSSWSSEGQRVLALCVFHCFPWGRVRSRIVQMPQTARGVQGAPAPE